MYGAILGDIIGSIYEHNNAKSRDFPLFSDTCFFTDDSICTVAVADSLLHGLDTAETLRKWGRKYNERKRGYGGRFHSWLMNDALGPYGSWGNGCAMRISPAAFLSATPEEALARAESITNVTHNHKESVRAASATTLAIYMGLTGVSLPRACGMTAAYFDYRTLVDPIEDIHARNHFDVSAKGTVPPALACVFAAKSWEEAIRNAIYIGGDSDTIACIAGAVAEAFFGIPAPILEHGRAMLPDDMRAVMDTMYAEKPGMRALLDWSTREKFEEIASRFAEEEPPGDA